MIALLPDRREVYHVVELARGATRWFPIFFSYLPSERHGVDTILIG